MTKLNRLFAVCLLITSMSAVAIADGGSTQGPWIYGDTQGPRVYGDEPKVAGAPASTTEGSSPILDALKTAESVSIWLLTEIF